MRKICVVLPDHLPAFLPEAPPDFRAFLVGDELPSLLLDPEDFDGEACRFLPALD